ncbi:unnamed protein product [Malus baccata var. baccata]
MDRILEAQGIDEEVQSLIFVVSQGKKKDLNVRESDGMLMQDKRMYVPNNEELKKEILDEAHISAYAMHPGGTKMYHTIRQFYYWPVCQQVKAERKKSFGLMQPLPVPQWKWENITMDFVYKLPRTRNGYDGVWIEILDSLLSSGQLFRKLLFGDDWHAKLDLMEFSYNNSYHSSIGMAPFEALYGKSCRTPLCWSEVGERVLVGPEIVEETTQNVQVIKSNLKVAQDRQKSLADRHVTDRVYKITERVGEVAYRLELPSELSKVYNVFHVSMLRHYVADPSHVIPVQPLEISPDLTYDEEPVTILDWKEKVLRNKTVQLVKVLWRNHSVEEATWETEDRMREMYPRLFYDY